MGRVANTFLLVSLMLLSIAPIGQPVVLSEDTERVSWTSSDTGSKINYTDEHTTVTIGPSGRQTTLEMPGGHDYSRPLPLVVSLHGYSGWGTQNSAYMHLYDSIHENEHLLISPDGNFNIIAMRYWNATDACCNLFDTDVDDVGYLLSLIDEAVQYYGADPDGVILTGLSNGGFMSHRMACDAGNSIRAIVALNGVTWDDFSDCSDTGRPDILHVHSTADSVIQYDGGSISGVSDPAATETVGYWADRSGCDASWTQLGSRDISGDDGQTETDEFEFLNCASGNRVAHWRINGGSHVPPLNDPGWANQTLDWALSGFVRDSDGDGYRDDVDAFIYNPSEWADSDGDNIGDNTDECDLDPAGWVDTDGDGVCTPTDVFPDDANEWSDRDGDGVGDNSDVFPDDGTEWVDSDGDGFGDNSDAFPDDLTEWGDLDEDGVGDNADEFPTDPNEWQDTDEDGYGDNSDVFPEDGTEWVDTDGDGHGDNSDAFPTDGNEWDDTDSDGVGDNADVFPDNPLEWQDTDGDGYGDNVDQFPEDGTEWVDTDSDGVGDNSDAFPEDASETMDTDGDGVGDKADVFPQDGTEWVDTDGDGHGDNSDAFPEIASEWLDTDGDGVGDNVDVFPLDSSEWIDTDEDGVGDNSDAFPMDDSETLDSDGDGYGDNRDWAPFDSEVWDEPPDYTLILLVGIVVLLLVAVTYNIRRQA